MDAISDTTDQSADKSPAFRAVENVYEMFGGIREAARYAGRNKSRLYVWRTTGVPTAAIKKFLDAAQELSLEIEANDFFDPVRLDAILAAKESTNGAANVG